MAARVRCEVRVLRAYLADDSDQPRTHDGDKKLGKAKGRS
jgi:hypothetical protein